MSISMYASRTIESSSLSRVQRRISQGLQLGTAAQIQHHLPSACAQGMTEAECRRCSRIPASGPACGVLEAVEALQIDQP